MNETLGGQKDQIYLVFADMGQMSNPGLCGISKALFFLFFQLELTPTAVDGYTFLQVRILTIFLFAILISFLQRFYSVYDTTNCQIGFATTEHTMATTN
jgi:hypothetical protein